MRRERRTYSVKVYHCKGCGHIFHTAIPEIKETCHHCGGELEIIDRYKSRYPPRVSPPQGRPWQDKGGVDKPRGKVNGS